MNVCRDRDCHLCCLDTTIPLLEEEIRVLEEQGHREFTVQVEGEIRLRNIEGQCFFLDPAGLCTAYDLRPRGCQYYPLVMVQHENGVRSWENDDYCPHEQLFPIGKKTVRAHRELMDRLDHELRQRTST